MRTRNKISLKFPKFPYWQKFEFQDCQGFPRTGKDSSSCGPFLTCATFSLTSPGPVLTSPGESWRYAAKDWNTEKSKTDSGPIRAEYVLYLVEKSVIGCSKKVFQYVTLRKSSNNHKTTWKILVFKCLGCPTEKQLTLAGLPTSRCIKKPLSQKYMNWMSTKTMLDVSQSPSKKQIRTSKISVYIVLAAQLKNSWHWQGYQRAGA